MSDLPSSRAPEPAAASRLERAGRLAWPLFGLVLFVMAVGRYLEYRSFGEPDGGWLSDGIMGIAFMAFPAVGALVASKQPRNRFGWLLLAIGAMAAVLVAASGHAAWELAVKGEVTPLAILTAWITQWLWFPLLFVTVTFVFLFFPTGEYLSPRWRWLGRLAWAALALITIPSMLQETLTGGSDGSGPSYEIDNPIGLPFISDAETQLEFLFIVFLPVVPLSAISLIFRYRRASSVERQQLKWVGVASLLFAFGVVLGDFIGLADVVFPLMLILVPISIAVAILRYRLYQIDVIINRTLVYGSLTALLIALYIGIVFILGTVLGPLTQDSDVAVAGSTLAVAGLFRPLRARVQTFIDRRFYRRKYNALHTLDEFSRRLRTAVDPEAVHRDVMTVVGETLTPERASLWLAQGTS